MHTSADYKYLGLVAFFVLLFGLAFIVWKWPQGKHLTFSQHVAVYKHTILYYVLLFSIALPLLSAFLIGWFMPTFNLSPWFGILVAASSLTQFACTLIPEVGGWKTRYHQLLAGVSALCLIPILVMLLTSNHVNGWGKIIAANSLLIMLGILYVVAVSKGKHSHALILQCLYFGSFFAPILYIGYA